ncbi:MAG: hypothetical protein IAE80_25315, partial [Anaerolinea sp.]|nr:hypothetical protein [Anaerolinea sp.]
GNLVADPLLDSSGSPINGSPTVNAGNNARVPGGVTTDITGTNDRIQQTTVDMGAYETVFYSPSVYMQVGGVGAGEGNQTGFRLNRSATTSAPLTVNFTVTGSASLTASDYEIVDEFNTLLTSSVTIPANEGDVDVTIRILDDIMAEPEETLTLTLTAGSGYTVGFPDSISNTIVQNDLVVTNGNDSGEGSLRQAVANVQAVGGDTITFSGVTTVNLTSGELAMENTSRVTIEGGAGVAVQRVSGSPDFRIFNVGLGDVTFNHLTITGGSTSGSGGGIYAFAGALTLNNSTVSGNAASSASGGGIFTSSSVTLNNSTISGNTASVVGGGVVAQRLTLNNSTVSGNSANSEGGGVYISVMLTLNNSIIANSISGGDCRNIVTLTARYSVIEDGTCGVSGTPASPDANGNFTGDPDLNPVTLIPNPGSPVIDRGNPAGVGAPPACLATDKNGTARPIDGDGDGTARCDIGAFEVTYTPPTITLTGGAAINEGQTTTFTLTRSYATGAPLTVNLTLTPNGGLSSGDYTLRDPANANITVSAVIPANQTSVILTFTAINDGNSAEPAESLGMAVAAGTGYAVGAPSTQTATINANGLLVTNTNNSGEGSLRQAVANANTFPSDDTIPFGVSGTITLNNPSLSVDNAVTAGRLTIDGSGQSVIIAGTIAHNIIVNSGGDLTVNNLTIAGIGGGILNSGNALTINNVTFSNNTSPTLGGAIANETGTVAITNSRFNDNYGPLGGAISNDSGMVTITNSSFSGNRTATSGGAIRSGGGTVTISNSTFSENSTSDTGVTIGNSGDMSIYNSTLNGGYGGNSSASIDNSGTLRLYNSIVANTIATANCTNSGSIDVRYSLIEDGSCGVSGTPASPDANGNFTGDPDINGTTLIPNPGSPVIDRGNPATVGGGGSTCLATDKNGTARPLDGDGDTVARCDMGAFEAPAAAVVTVSALDGGADETSGDNGLLRFSRVGNTSGALIVNFTPSGDAINGSDYYLSYDGVNALPGNAVTISAGQTSVDVWVTPIDDLPAEAAESLTVTLASGAYSIGVPNSASVSIAQNDYYVNTTNDGGTG